MKIIIMVHKLTGGGAERVAVSWANGLDALSHNIVLFTDSNGKTYQTNKNITIEERKSILKFNNNISAKLIRKILNPIIIFWQLLKLVKTIKPDAIINVLYLDSYSLLLARLFAGKKFPIIMTDHNAYERPKNSKYKWRQWKNKFLDNYLFDKVTVLTKRDKEILRRKGFKNIEVLNNPLFLEPIDIIPNKEKIVLAVGRLDAWYVKGFDLLLKAWNELCEKYPDWHLVIIGSGSNHIKDKLQDLTHSNLNNVIFKDFTTNIAEEYKKAEIFVLSSRYEGWGLVAIEAMSQGCATIACDFHGRQSEFITDNNNGILCKPDDYVELKSKIELLIQDTHLRRSIQNNAIKGLDIYEENVVAQKLELLINTVKSE